MLTTPTPGRQHTGRFAVLDDLALYGSQQAIALLASEGALGLFAHSAATVADFSDELLRVGVNATPHVWIFTTPVSMKCGRLWLEFMRPFPTPAPPLPFGMTGALA